MAVRSGGAYGLGVNPSTGLLQTIYSCHISQTSGAWTMWVTITKIAQELQWKSRFRVSIISKNNGGYDSA